MTFIYYYYLFFYKLLNLYEIVLFDENIKLIFV